MGKLDISLIAVGDKGTFLAEPFLVSGRCKTLPTIQSLLAEAISPRLIAVSIATIMITHISPEASASSRFSSLNEMRRSLAFPGGGLRIFITGLVSGILHSLIAIVNK